MHERFTAAEIREYRAAHPGITVLAHPECPPEVVAEADFAGSTAAMIGYVGKHHPGPRGADHRMFDELDNVAADYPDVEFVRPCNLCPHMRRITLKGHSAFASDHDSPKFWWDPAAFARGRAVAIDRMLAVRT